MPKILIFFEYKLLNSAKYYIVFFTFATVMCDFLNRDVRFLEADSADRLDSVTRKFSRIFLFVDLII